MADDHESSTKTLDDATNTLDDATNTLDDAMNTLDDATNTLDDATNTLDDGNKVSMLTPENHENNKTDISEKDVVTSEKSMEESLSIIETRHKKYYRKPKNIETVTSSEEPSIGKKGDSNENEKTLASPPETVFDLQCELEQSKSISEDDSSAPSTEKTNVVIQEIGGNNANTSHTDEFVIVIEPKKDLSESASQSDKAVTEGDNQNTDTNLAQNEKGNDTDMDGLKIQKVYSLRDRNNRINWSHALGENSDTSEGNMDVDEEENNQNSPDLSNVQPVVIEPVSVKTPLMKTLPAFRSQGPYSKNLRERLMSQGASRSKPSLLNLYEQKEMRSPNVVVPQHREIQSPNAMVSQQGEMRNPNVVVLQQREIHSPNAMVSQHGEARSPTFTFPQQNRIIGQISVVSQQGEVRSPSFTVPQQREKRSPTVIAPQQREVLRSPSVKIPIQREIRNPNVKVPQQKDKESQHMIFLNADDVMVTEDIPEVVWVKDGKLLISDSNDKVTKTRNLGSLNTLMINQATMAPAALIRSSEHYECPRCPMIFSLHADWLKHRLQCLGETTESSLRYYCNRCPASFARHRNWVIHRKSHAVVCPKWMCDRCYQKFTSRRDLREHRICCTGTPGQSVNKPKFRCDICDKSFPYPSALKVHSETHVLKHKCPICNQPFTRFYEMTKHVRNDHPDVEAHSCEHCGKMFDRLTMLYRHRSDGDCPVLNEMDITPTEN